jgi:hypothetical protein
VILSDSVIEARGSDDKLANFGAVRFTYQTDAADYNRHTNVYGGDAVAIARQLIDDLNKRGGDLWYRVQSRIHIETAEDARRNLVRIMAENFASRTWYRCGSNTACVFDENMPHHRVNGIFHVWKLKGSSGGEMLNVDGWHPPKVATTK